MKHIRIKQFFTVTPSYIVDTDTKKLKGKVTLNLTDTIRLCEIVDDYDYYHDHALVMVESVILVTNEKDWFVASLKDCAFESERMIIGDFINRMYGSDAAKETRFTILGEANANIA